METTKMQLNNRSLLKSQQVSMHSRTKSVDTSAAKPIRVSTLLSPTGGSRVQKIQFGRAEPHTPKDYSTIQSQSHQRASTAHDTNALNSARQSRDKVPLSSRGRSVAESDLVFRKTGLTVGTVAGTERTNPFGEELYYPPREDLKYKIKTGAHSRGQRVIAWEQKAKKLQKYPGPPHYSKIQEWEKNFPRRGMFLKKNRDTFTDDTIKFEKVKVGPNRYKQDQWKKFSKIEGTYTYKDDRVVFTDTAKATISFHKTERLFGKYDNMKQDAVRKRVLAAHIVKPQPKSTWMIPKSNEPGPGSYPTAEAIQKSQWAAIKGPHKSTSENICFTDKYKALYKHIPGAGTYQNIDNHAKVLHKDALLKPKRQ